MGFFEKVRSIFGLNTSNDESPIDVLDNLVLEESTAKEELEKAQTEFDLINNEYSLKLQGCDKLISQGSKQGELNKGIIEKKLKKLTDEYAIHTKEHVDAISAITEKRIALETEIITKAIQTVAEFQPAQQAHIKDLMDVWQETGLIEGEGVDYQAKAIVKAIGIVQKESGDVSIAEAKKKIKNDLKGHYVNSIVKRDDKILFLKRGSNDDLAPGQWCLPGGKIEDDENINQAACRELEEETNLCCDPDCFYALGKAKCEDGKWAFYFTCYPSGDVALLDGENQNAAWMTMDEWMEADLMMDLKDHLIAILTPERSIDNIPTIKKAEDFFFEKAEAAKVGEIRTWSGNRKWIKTENGWKPVKGDKNKEKVHNTQELVAHAENTSTDQLKKIIADKSKDAHLRDAAKRELERRNEEKDKEKRKWAREDKVRSEDKADAAKEKKEEAKAKAKEKEEQEKTKKAEAKKKAKEEADKKKEEDKKPKKIKPDETFSGTMTLLKNTEKAPNMGSRFGQDVEPAGFYATQKETEHLDDHPNYKTFTVDIKKPLVIDVSKDRIQWKRDLADRYKSKGAKLSKQLMAEGYDSIITTDEYGYTGEIIILNTERLKEVDLKKSEDDDLSKGKRYEYVKVNRGGKIFYQYREVGTDKVDHELPVGDHFFVDNLGLKVTRYSDKSLLISGQTLGNLELLRKIKADLGVGNYNKNLGGWIFPLSGKEKILGALIPNMPESTFEETIAKEAAVDIKNSVDVGSSVTVDGKELKVESIDANVKGVGYEVKGGDKVTETEVGIVPVTDATEVLNNTNEENRFKSGKEVFGKEEGDSSVSEEITEAGESNKSIEIKEFTTRSGEQVNALDYTHIKQMNIQLVDQDGILDKPKPNWCADINLPVFAGPKNDQFVFDYVKMGEDQYLLALNGFEKGPSGWRNTSGHQITNKDLRDDLLSGKYTYMDLERPNVWGNSNDGYTIQIGENKYHYTVMEKDKFFLDQDALQNNHHTQYAVVSLDQIVAMQDYYQKFAKAVIAKKKEIETEKVLERMKGWDDAKIQKYYPFDYDRRLSEKQKKKYTKEQWDALPKEAKIAEVPFMKHPAVELPSGKRISQLPDDRMKMSNFDMYKKFVNKSYLTPKDKNSRYYDSSSDPCVIEYNEVRDQLQWRKIDLKLQREENDSSYEKGYQTSYGEVNVKDDLLGSHGVKIKLQNGKDVKEIHTEQIKEHLSKVYESFGNRANIAKEVGLKISHSGDKMMFARNALGLYVPSMKAIGVSDNKKHGKFGLTLAHEFAHFIDNYVGNKHGRHYASDNLNSSAGKIANTFRSHMNAQADSDYLNRTCECFARALEQYHAIKTDGEGAIKSQADLVPYSDRPEHVSNEKFNTHIRPLIDQFLKENEDLMKSINFEFE